MATMSEKMKQELLEVIAAEEKRDAAVEQKFLDAFKKALEALKERQAQMEDKIDQKTEDAVNELNRIMKKLEDDNTVSFSNFKKWALEAVSKYIAKSGIDGKIEELDALYKKLESYELPDASSIALEASKMAQDGLLPLIPIVDKLEEKLPELGAPIRDGLELLQDGEKLTIDAIQDLRQKLNDLEKKVLAKSTVISGGGSTGRHNSTFYDLSSSLDGSTKTFSLPSFWRINAVLCSSTPNVMRPTVDFTSDASASTITFTSAITESTTLAVGQTVIILYEEV